MEREMKHGYNKEKEKDAKSSKKRGPSIYRRMLKEEYAEDNYKEELRELRNGGYSISYDRDR